MSGYYRVERAASPAVSAMGLTAQQYSKYENGYPLLRAIQQ